MIDIGSLLSELRRDAVTHAAQLLTEQKGTRDLQAYCDHASLSVGIHAGDYKRMAMTKEEADACDKDATAGRYRYVRCLNPLPGVRMDIGEVVATTETEAEFLRVRGFYEFCDAPPVKSEREPNPLLGHLAAAARVHAGVR